MIGGEAMFARRLQKRPDTSPSGVDRSRERPGSIVSDEDLPDSPPGIVGPYHPKATMKERIKAKGSQALHDTYQYVNEADKYSTTYLDANGPENDGEALFAKTEINVETMTDGKPRQPKIMKVETTPDGLTMKIFGEDIILENPRLGITILIDVTSTAGPTRLEFGKKGARNLMWFFENIPDFLSTTEAKIDWLQKNLQHYLATLNGPECEGVFMVTAVKVMPNQREAIIFDIGPNELGIYADGATTNAKKRTDSTKSALNGSERFAICKSRQKGDETYIVGDEVNTVPYFYSIPIPEGGVIIGGSDGYQETTGQSLLSVDGKIDPAIEPKDDISCFMIKPKTSSEAAGLEMAAK